MFHFRQDDTSKATVNPAMMPESRKLIDKAFHRYSSSHDKSLLFKTDFKCAWLYLFGYKIAKVSIQTTWTNNERSLQTSRKSCKLLERIIFISAF